MDCWTTFAHHGDPNHRGRPVWARVHGGSGPALGLDADPIVPTQFAATTAATSGSASGERLARCRREQADADGVDAVGASTASA